MSEFNLTRLGTKHKNMRRETETRMSEKYEQKKIAMRKRGKRCELRFEMERVLNNNLVFNLNGLRACSQQSAQTTTNETLN